MSNVTIDGYNIIASKFRVSRDVKMRQYSLAHAHSNSFATMKAKNRIYDISIDITDVNGGVAYETGIDVETLMVTLSKPTNILVDTEGNTNTVSVQSATINHAGGQPTYYTLDIKFVDITNNPPVALPICPLPPPPPITKISVVELTPDPDDTHDGFQRRSFYANGRWWVFWYNGIPGNTPYYYPQSVTFSTSLDGVTWTRGSNFTPNTRALVVGSSSTGSVWFDGTHFVLVTNASNPEPSTWINLPVVYNEGTPHSDGTITWLQLSNQLTEQFAGFSQTTTRNTSGYYWVATDMGSNSGGIADIVENDHTDGTFDLGLAGNPSNHSVDYREAIVPLDSGGIAIVYPYGVNSQMNVIFYNGSSWSTPPTPTTNILQGAVSFSAVTIGDIVHIVFLNSSNNIAYAQFDTNMNQFTQEKIIATPSDANARPTISKNTASGGIYVFYPINSTNTINYLYMNNSGVWSLPQSFISSTGAFPDDNRIISSWDDVGGYIQVLFMSTTNEYVYINPPGAWWRLYQLNSAMLPT